MEEVILTPRLKLVLQKTAKPGSDDLRDYHMLRSDPGATLWTFTGPSKSIEETQRVLISNHLPICEKEGDIRQYRTSYGVYIRLPTEPDESETQVRDPVNFIGRVGAKECAEYGPPFADNLTIPKDILENEKILKFEIGYALLSKAWGKGYATEAMKAFVEAYLNSRGFWHPTYQQLYLHGVTGGANHRSARVMEKTGFTLNGIHRWDGPDVFIGGAMQPPEVHVFSLGPSASSYRELESSHNS